MIQLIFSSPDIVDSSMVYEVHWAPFSDGYMSEHFCFSSLVKKQAEYLVMGSREKGYSITYSQYSIRPFDL